MVAVCKCFLKNARWDGGKRRSLRPQRKYMGTRSRRASSSGVKGCAFGTSRMRARSAGARRAGARGGRGVVGGRVAPAGAGKWGRGGGGVAGDPWGEGKVPGRVPVGAVQGPDGGQRAAPAAALEDANRARLRGHAMARV